jgi:PAS domain S-box-containing protein
MHFSESSLAFASANGVTMVKSAQSELKAQDKAAWDPIEDLPVAYLEFNAQGTIMYANSVARSLHCDAGDNLIGKSAWDIVASDQIDLGRKAFMAIMASGEEPPVIQRALYTNKGEYRTYEMFRSLIRDAQKRPAGMRYVYIDITKVQNTCDEAEQNQHFMWNIMESLSEAVIVIDPLEFVYLINQEAEELTGWKAAEIFRKPIKECLVFVSCEMENNAKFSFCGALDKPYAGTAIILDRKDQKVQVEINTSPIVDKKNGYTMGVVITLRKPKSVLR